jgi:hypothetical protein
MAFAPALNSLSNYLCPAANRPGYKVCKHQTECHYSKNLGDLRRLLALKLQFKFAVRRIVALPKKKDATKMTAQTIPYINMPVNIFCR